LLFWLGLWGGACSTWEEKRNLSASGRVGEKSRVSSIAVSARVLVFARFEEVTYLKEVGGTINPLVFKQKR